MSKNYNTGDTINMTQQKLDIDIPANINIEKYINYEKLLQKRKEYVKKHNAKKITMRVFKETHKKLIEIANINNTTIDTTLNNLITFYAEAKS